MLVTVLNIVDVDNVTSALSVVTVLKLTIALTAAGTKIIEVPVTISFVSVVDNVTVDDVTSATNEYPP